MKKIISIILLIISVLFVFSSCSADRIEIDDYEWKMRYIMHLNEDGDQIIYDAVEEINEFYSNAKVISLKLVAKEGTITIFDETNKKTYEGTYVLSDKNIKGSEYNIVIDGKTGYAGVAMTTYADNTQEPTLPIKLGTYSMYFYAK